MKGKGLPVYFVQPTQMHKECSLATLDCYGIFFSRWNDPPDQRKNSFSRWNDPQNHREILFSRWNDPQANEKFYFRVGTTLRPTKNFTFALE